jgi:hypothetical protein
MFRQNLVEKMKSKKFVFQSVLLVLMVILIAKIAHLNFWKHENSIAFTGLARVINDKSENKGVQQNYYSELAKGILNKQLSFTVEPTKELLEHDNPYGADAHNAGLEIQDASLFDGKYYLYYGPLPVFLTYIPIKAAFGFIPTDALVVTLYSGFYIAIVTFLGWNFIRTNFSVSSAFFVTFLFNPIMLFCYGGTYTAGVSRVFCAILLCLGYAFIFQSLKNRNGQTLQATVGLLCLAAAAITRPTYVIDFSVLSILIIYYFLHEPAVKIIKVFVPSVSLLILKGVYNYARFNNIFDDGQKYITNGQDFLHKGMVHLPKDVLSLVYNLIYKIWEFLFLLPSFPNPGSPPLVNLSTVTPYIKGAYTAGTVGYLYFAPALLLFIMLLVRDKAKSVPERFKPLYFSSLLVFVLNFGMFSLWPLTALHFYIEMIPRLMIVVFLGISFSWNSIATLKWQKYCLIIYSIAILFSYFKFERF